MQIFVIFKVLRGRSIFAKKITVVIVYRVYVAPPMLFALGDLANKWPIERNHSRHCNSSLKASMLTRDFTVISTLFWRSTQVGTCTSVHEYQ